MSLPKEIEEALANTSSAYVEDLMNYLKQLKQENQELREAIEDIKVTLDVLGGVSSTKRGS